MEEGGAVRIVCPEKREGREGDIVGRDRASDRRGRGKEKPRPSRLETGAGHFIGDRRATTSIVTWERTHFSICSLYCSK